MKDRVNEAKRIMEKCVAEHEAKSKLIESQYREKEIKLQAGLRK